MLHTKRQLSKTALPSFKGAAAGWWQNEWKRRGIVAVLSAEVKVCVCMCERVLLAALRVIATDPKVTDHPNCVFTHFIINHHTDQQWPDCSYGQRLWMKTNTLCFCPLSVRYSFLAWTHCSQQPTVSESQLWRPDVLSHVWRGPPAELLQLLHSLIVLRLARVVKLGPGSRPPPLWSTQPGSAAEAALPAPLSQLPHTQGGQSQTDSPPLPPEPPSHFPLLPPTTPLSFSIFEAIRRRSLSFVVFPWKGKKRENEKKRRRRAKLLVLVELRPSQEPLVKPWVLGLTWFVWKGFSRGQSGITLQIASSHGRDLY